MGLAVRRSIIINAPRLHSTSCCVKRAAIWESARSGLVISLLCRLCPVWASRAEQADSICRGVIILPRFSAPILRMRCKTLIFSPVRLGRLCPNGSCLGWWASPICSHVQPGRTYCYCSPAPSWRRAGEPFRPRCASSGANAIPTFVTSIVSSTVQRGRPGRRRASNPGHGIRGEDRAR